jgi:hypothetical protein
MKQILLAATLALSTLGAHANVIATTTNDAGGAIQFSDVACNDPGMPYGLGASLAPLNFGSKGPGYLAVATDRSDNGVSYGCSYTDGNSTIVHWITGQVRYYRTSTINFIQ